MNQAYISIGTNMGDRYDYLTQTVEALRKIEGIFEVETSSIYETTPVGVTDQPDFLNMVAKISTTLAPQDLLLACQQIEQQLGRVRTIRWGPRTADLDILLYNNDIIETETLIVPHPRMGERAFVLIPLTELAPELCDPLTGDRYQRKAIIQEDVVNIWKPADADK